MFEKNARELYDEWLQAKERARDHLRRLPKEYGFVAQEVRPGEPIKRPDKGLTPEAIDEIQALDRKLDELWKAYRERIS